MKKIKKVFEKAKKIWPNNGIRIEMRDYIGREAELYLVIFDSYPYEPDYDVEVIPLNKFIKKYEL